MLFHVICAFLVKNRMTHMWHFSREEGRSVPREIAPVCARQSEGLRYSDLTLREKFLGVVEVVAGHWMWDDVGSNP